MRMRQGEVINGPDGLLHEAQRRLVNPGRLTPKDIALAALLPALIAVALSRDELPSVLRGGLLNPDSYMRLVRLRETLAAHHPVYAISNDSSGAGTVLHWSHLLECLLCAIAAPFQLILSTPSAIHAAALFVGPLLMAGMGVAVTWTAAPFASERYPWLAAVLVAASPGIRSYALVGVVHHHVLLVIIAVVMAGWAARLMPNHKRGGSSVAGPASVSG